MDYSKFKQILNKHIFEEEKIELLKKIADYPERFIGLFRPSKPGTKILQNLLQSHEIRFGNALEEVIEEILKDLGYIILPKSITTADGKELSIDQFFKDKNGNIYFIEQKVRDDHDSSKKEGQIQNFEKKLEEIYKRYSNNNITGIMYFIDPDFMKNRNFYEKKLRELSNSYKVNTYLFYGKELFEFLNAGQYWEDLLNWLKQWKEELPEIPEIDFDKEPEKSFKEIKELETKYWKKLLQNDKLWEEGIMQTIFRNGKTLKLLSDYFNEKSNKELAKMIDEKLNKYYKQS